MQMSRIRQHQGRKSLQKHHHTTGSNRRSDSHFAAPTLSSDPQEPAINILPYSRIRQHQWLEICKKRGCHNITGANRRENPLVSDICTLKALAHKCKHAQARPQPAVHHSVHFSPVLTSLPGLVRSKALR